jgi:hypothetical protein
MLGELGTLTVTSNRSTLTLKMEAMFLRNVGSYMSHTVSHPRIRHFSLNRFLLFSSVALFQKTVPFNVKVFASLSVRGQHVPAEGAVTWLYLTPLPFMYVTPNLAWFHAFHFHDEQRKYVEALCLIPPK